MGSWEVVLASRLVIFSILYLLQGYVPIVPFLVSKEEVGIILSVQAWASVAALIPAGYGIDRHSAKVVLQIGIVMSLSSILLMASRNFEVQLLARILLGGATSVIFNSAMALIMEYFNEPKRSEHLGLAVGLGSLGNVAGPPCMGALFDKASIEGLPEPQFWAALPPFLLFLVILQILSSVNSKNETLLQHLQDAPDERGESKARPLNNACGGLYLFANAQVLVLTFELICVFGANNCFMTAGAIELHRNGFSSSWIGMIAMPSGLMQCLISQWAGRLAGSAKNRERILLYTPALLGVLLLASCLPVRLAGESSDSSHSSSHSAELPMRIVLTLIFSSAGLGAVDAPAMSMMADLAASENLGYGQALTASEMAINAGLALGPSLATLALAASWSYVHLSLAAAACSCVAALCSAFALRDVPHSSYSS